MKKYCYWGVLIAWVLWIRTQSPTSDSWNALPGFASRETVRRQCKGEVGCVAAVQRCRDQRQYRYIHGQQHYHDLYLLERRRRSAA